MGSYRQFLCTLQISLLDLRDRKDHSEGSEKFILGAIEGLFFLVTDDIIHIHLTAQGRILGNKARIHLLHLCYFKVSKCINA
ncbi:hypothetical protein D3C73_1607660 [compost metagenome]